MALKIVFVIIGMALLVSSAPHESHERHDSSEEVDPILYKVCPDHSNVCLEKLLNCFEQMMPASKEEQEKEEKIWNENYKSCSKTLRGSAKNVSMYQIEKCAADRIYLTADGEVNVDLVKQQLKLSNFSTTDVLEAVFTAADSCPTNEPDKFFGYYTCIMEKCVAATESE